MEALILIATLWLATIQKRLNALLALGWGRPFKSTFVSQLAQSADIRLIVRHHCGVIRERYPAKANAAQKEGDEDSERRNQKAQVDALAI